MEVSRLSEQESYRLDYGPKYLYLRSALFPDLRASQVQESPRSWRLGTGGRRGDAVADHPAGSQWEHLRQLVHPEHDN